MGITYSLMHADDKQGQKLTKAEAFLAGGVARAAAAAATCPFTVVKTRMEYAGSSVQYTVTHLKTLPRVCGLLPLNFQAQLCEIQELPPFAGNIFSIEKYKQSRGPRWAF